MSASPKPLYPPNGSKAPRRAAVGSLVSSPQGPSATPSGSNSPSRSRRITSVIMYAEVPISSTIAAREEGTAIAIGLVPRIGRMPPGGASSGELDAVWIVFGDHLNIVGAAPAHPGVGHRNERNAVGRSFLDRRLRC